jgi:hypothetical protein
MQFACILEFVFINDAHPCISEYTTLMQFTSILEFVLHQRCPPMHLRICYSHAVSHHFRICFALPQGLFFLRIQGAFTIQFAQHISYFYGRYRKTNRHHFIVKFCKKKTWF